MKSRERAVCFYEVCIKSSTRTNGISSPHCIGIKKAFELISSLDRSQLEQAGRKTEMVVIEDWRFEADRNEYHILINRADRDVPDIALKDFKTKTVRYAGKKPQEGIDLSTHIIVRLNKAANSKKALFLVTQGGGITMSRLERLLGHLMRMVKASGKHKSDFEIAHPNGVKGAVYKTSYSFEVCAYKSAHLDECLRRGTLLGVDLISSDGHLFDDGGNLQVRERIISLVPAYRNTPVTVAIIKNAITKSGNKFDHAKIKFKQADGTPQTETFSADDLDAAFTKRVWMKFESDIPSHTTVIDKIIIDKMIEVCK